jgi:cobaltochelatase CobN
VKSVYLDDRYKVGLDKFLESGENVHVKTNMMAILLVAAQKGFWQADDATLQKLSQQWVDLLLAHGLPGSGHTRPDHPVFDWVMPKLRADQREPLRQMLAKAQVSATPKEASPATMTELKSPTPEQKQPQQQQASADAKAQPSSNRMWLVWALAGVLVTLLMSAGYWRGRRDFASDRAASEVAS